MRLSRSLFLLIACAVAASVSPAASEEAGLRIAQANAPAGPPNSGWTVPAARSQAAPPSSGWTAPGAAPRSGAAPSAGWTAPGGGPQRDCAGEFMPLREEAEKKAAVIKAASQRKQQAELCSAFRNFAAAEAKVVKYAEDHGAECRIPADAVKAIKGNHAKTIEIRNKICAAPTAVAPRAPSLSDALGTSRIPQAPAEGAPARRGAGAFDTLTGNPLAR